MNPESHPQIMLQAEDLHVRRGGVPVLAIPALSVYQGQILVLIGPNGAGKSTILKTIFGLAELSAGRVFWHEHPVNPVPHKMVAEGIAFVPQGRRVFRHLTVRENLEIGGFIVRDKKSLQERIDEVLEFFPALKQKLNAKSAALSGGQQQMLAIARALVTRPRVLLLDEPSLGLAPKIVKEVFAKIKEINERHKTAIFVVTISLVIWTV